MLNGYEFFPLLGALGALACGGNAVDVGHSANRGWADVPVSDAPGNDTSAAAAHLIYESDQAIFGFALDETTLYALIDHDATLELVACPIEHCRSQRTVLLRSPKLGQEGPEPTPLVLTGGWLYWMVGSGAPGGVAGCPATGCSEAQFLPTTFNSLLAGDADGAYWIDGDKSLMRITPGAAAPERLQELGEDVVDARHLLARGDYMYFSLGYAISTIHRVRKDGSTASELLATDEKLSGLAVTPDRLYYASQILTGRIAECPPDGCQTGASTFIAAQRWPAEIQIDGNTAFWLSSATFVDRWPRAVLSSCELPDCASVRQWAGDVPLFDISDEYSRGPTFAVNQRTLVWSGRHGNSGTSFWSAPR